MALRPYLVAWSIVLAFALAARWAAASVWNLHVAATYALASLAVVAAAALAYRRRLAAFLSDEHPALWRSLEARPGHAPAAVLLRWLLAGTGTDDPEIRAARRTGAQVLVIVVTWLMSTPAVCFVLAITPSA